MADDILDRILQNDSVPTIPAFAVRIVQLCGDPDVCLREVAELVQHDTATSAKLLRLANSSQVGLARDVSSVQEAVGVLGLSSVRMVTIATALVGGLDAPPSGLDAPTFWRGALVTSFAAHRLATRLDAMAMDYAFLAGLMQNLGVYLMASGLGEAYGDLLEECADDPLKLGGLELERFGTTHAHVGSELLRSWGFPQVVVDAVRHHGDEEQSLVRSPSGQLAGILRVAESFRAALLVPGPDQSAEFLRRNQALLDLSGEAAVELMTYVEAHVAEVGEVFDLDFGSPQVLEKARMQATSELMRMVLQTQAEQCRAEVEKGGDESEQRVCRFELLGVSVMRAGLDKAYELRQELGEKGLQRVLAGVTRSLRSTLRRTDLILRWGHTGWLIVLPLGDPELVRRVGDRIGHGVRSAGIRTSQGEMEVTLSIGATFSHSCESDEFPRLVRLADVARRVAVDLGGDQVHCPARAAGEQDDVFAEFEDASEVPCS